MSHRAKDDAVAGYLLHSSGLIRDNGRGDNLGNQQGQEQDDEDEVELVRNEESECDLSDCMAMMS